MCTVFFFFFQAEDGIRDFHVTGVQTCALPISIATSAVLAVVYPHMTGLGGDAFWLIHDGASGEIDYLSGGGKATAAASLAVFAQRGIREIPLRGIVPATLTVPGGVASWIAAHESRGRLPLPRV